MLDDLDVRTYDLCIAGKRLPQDGVSGEGSTCNPSIMKAGPRPKTVARTAEGSCRGVVFATTTVAIPASGPATNTTGQQQVLAQRVQDLRQQIANTNAPSDAAESAAAWYKCGNHWHNWGNWHNW
jgi:hypothetical protein